MAALFVLAMVLLVTDAGCFWQDDCHYDDMGFDDACGIRVLAFQPETRLATNGASPPHEGLPPAVEAAPSPPLLTRVQGPKAAPRHPARPLAASLSPRAPPRA